MPSTTTTSAARDGTPLLVRDWPASEDPWLHILIVHGLEDHSGRFERVGDHYGADGIVAHSFDQRWVGHGGGRTGDILRWEDLLDDIEDRLGAVRAAAGELPVAIHAHSLGGLQGADYLMGDRPAPDLAILSAPAMGDGLAGWKHAIGPPLARIAPGLKLPNDFDPTSLARDLSDPLLFGPDPLRITSTSTRMAAFSFAAQERVTAAVRAASAVRIPTMVIHGSADRLVPPRASEPFENVAGATRIVYPELRHEMHNEPEGPVVVADLVDWLTRQVKSPSDGSTPARE